ncbi:hypothetical protein ACFU6R_13875 [Streptomyces sp. NPDC057499]|uniref:hypothetical protein n=1 Tax=Streptomyces sp. NPDC057499 TaxID=3346150 RepID=UPI00368857DD
MASLFERLDLEEAVVRGELSALSGELEALHGRIAAAEGRLADLVITRKTVVSLGGSEYAAHDAEGCQPDAGDTNEPDPDHGPCASPPRADGTAAGESEPAGPLEREVTRERALVLLAGAGRPMYAKDIAAAIGEDVSDTSKGRRVETTRSRLKALVREGRLVEGPTAWFAIAPTNAGEQRHSNTPHKRRDPAQPLG